MITWSVCAPISCTLLALAVTVQARAQAQAVGGVQGLSEIASRGVYATGIGPGGVLLTRTSGKRLYSSFAISTGYDTAVDSLPNAAGSLLLGEFSLGVLSRYHRFNLLIENDLKLSRSFGTGIGLQHFDRTAALFTGDVSRRTSWSLQLENGYGSDSARAVGTLTTSSVSTAIPSQDTAAFETATGTTLNDHVALGLDHTFSAKSSSHFGGETYIRHFFNTGETSRQYNVDAGLTQTLTRNLSGGLRAEVVQQDYSALHCTTASLTLTGRLEIGRSIHLQGSRWSGHWIGPLFRQLCL